jgi:hypothetical protein
MIAHVASGKDEAVSQSAFSDSSYSGNLVEGSTEISLDLLCVSFPGLP